MTEPTTAEIRERYNYVESAEFEADISPDLRSHEALSDNHTHIGILLDRLEKAEQTIKAASELSVFNSGLGYVFCRELNAALNRSKS